ncbi:hypothetical protein P3102_29130 [Amycolatopsis sp. QT-25]|uniref:hypothetical protein n=1 Tax=Amycolatopsis sp. QT-25 TaxID=3034022 RepID=UPI0023EBF8B4|nr:hypothetical protein [Amycolatopsis sp. QT-25]WET78099.1 hypothetical protein P3102_29130 [Amycolatopsis sp. QT-25]
MVTAGTVLWFGQEQKTRFVDIAQCDRLPRLKGSDDLLGAIELEIDGVLVLDRDLIDDIIGMWIIVARMVDDYRQGLEAKSAIPTQKIYFELKPLPRGRVLVSVEGGGDRRAVAAGEEELLFALRFAGNEFFGKMEDLAGRYWPEERARLNAGSEFQ